MYADWVKLKARGRAISKAVAVAEMAKRALKARVGEVRIGSEEVACEGAARRVSTIEITLLGG